MIETSRGYSFVVYSYEGGPLSFVLPFQYLDKSHIRAYIGEGETATPIAFSWVSSNTIAIPDATAGAPYSVTIRRVTPIDVPLVNFQDGARLPADDLNRIALQLLFLQQERADYGDAGNSAPSALPGGSTPAWSVEYLAQQVLNSVTLQNLINTVDYAELFGETVLGEVERSSALLEARAMLNDRVAIAEVKLDTVVSDNAALATAVTTVSATVDANSASIEERFTALATGSADPAEMWSALYSLKLTGVSSTGVPVVAGIGLGINPVTGSEFIVAANKFAIVDPAYLTGDSVPKAPFVVGTVNGVATVGINGALAVDGSITADKLTVTNLSALTANAGTLNGGTFKTHTLDVNGDIINPTEFRCEMTNIGSYPLWIGTGAKTEGNAVFYIKNDGSAKFAGDIMAPNVLGNLQVSVNLYSTSSTPVTGPTNYTTVYSFTLPAPIRPGESHSPAVNLTVLMATFRQAIVILEYLDGSVWTECSKADAGDVTGSADAFIYSNALSLSGSLPPTTAAVQFRVRVTHNVSGTGNVTGIRGFAFGIR